MKRTIFLLIFCLFAATFAQAQSRDVRRASRQLSRGNIAEAMEYMDAAMQDESSLSDPATWLTRSKLYMEIYASEDPEVKKLAEKPLDTAYQSLMKARELDTDNTNIIDIQQTLLVLSEMLFNEGVEFYNNKKYGIASTSFLRSYELAESFGSIDTTTLYNAALALELNDDLDEARKYYEKLLEMDYNQPYLYGSLSTIAFQQGDTAQSIEYIREGRERYPDDLNLIFNEANIHIFAGNVEKAGEVLDLAIQRDPDNPNLHFTLGANYDQMAQDTTYSDEERRFAYEQAIQAYNRAIELDPDYFDAIYNLGVLYFNEGIRIFEEADLRLRETQDFEAYQKDEERFREMWLKAQPYLEQAMELLPENDPDLEVVVASLMQLYTRTNQPEKYKSIEKLYRSYFGEEEQQQQEQQ